MMYDNSRTVVKTNHENSEEFKVNVGVRQGLLLSPLLFMAVIKSLTCEAREGLPRELLYLDHLVLVVESTEEMEKILRWQECMEAKRLKINTRKTI